MKTFLQMAFLSSIALALMLLGREWGESRIFQKLSLERRCQMADAQACLELSQYQMGPIYQKLTKRTPFYFALKGCHFGSAEACLSLSTRFENEMRALPIGEKLLGQTLHKSCLLGEPSACLILANNHEARGDIKGSLELKNRACWFGISQACVVN